MDADDNPPSQSHAEEAPDDTARLNCLLERVCDQLATPDELAELEALLIGDKFARERYLRYVSLHACLVNGAIGRSPNAATNIDRRAIDASLPRSKRRRWLVRTFAAAATLAAITIGAAEMRHSPSADRVAKSSATMV